MIKNVFFDLDDTLLDFKRAERESLIGALGAMGIPHGDEILDLYSKINKECWLKLERKEYTKEEVLTNRFVFFFSELGIQADPMTARKEYERRLAENGSRTVGALEILEELVKKYRLFVVSNGVSAVQRSRINRAGLDKYFEKIFISEDVGCEKPAKEFFDRVLCGLTGVLPKESLIVGDSMSADIPAGMSVGMYTCLFNPRKKPLCGNIIPDFQIERLSEITERVIKSIK